MLIAVNFPALPLIFFGGLLDLANFQFIDLTNFYNKLFHLDPDCVGNNPLNDRFELMGYSSLYIVQNFGMLCLSIFLPFVMRMAAPLLVLIFK